MVVVVEVVVIIVVEVRWKFPHICDDKTKYFRLAQQALTPDLSARGEELEKPLNCLMVKKCLSDVDDC